VAPPGDLDVREETIPCRSCKTKRDSSNWQLVAYTVYRLRYPGPLMLTNGTSNVHTFEINYCSFRQHCTKVTPVEILVFFNIDG